MSRIMRGLLVSMIFMISLFPGPSVGAVLQEAAPGIVLVGIKDAQQWWFDMPLKLDIPVDRLYNPQLAAIGVTALRIPVGEMQSLLSTLHKDARFSFAEPDYRVKVESMQTPITNTLPNDPYFANQWSLERIHAPQAWSHSSGDPSITIAILDSGIQANHPDLVDKLWVNPNEIAANQIDDDGNGKVDDIHGWHFYHKYTAAGYMPAEDGIIDDDLGHGTHVSGIAAAESNNSIGIAGISWGSRVLTVKVIDEFGNGWYSDIASGIVYAVDNGAQIINLSLGGVQPSETLKAAIDYAIEHGVVVVAAAGNTGEAVLYPAAYAPVIAVAATDKLDTRVSYSNIGDAIDIAAPGEEIFSTWYRSNYFIRSGTSMAAPHVSGTVALMLSQAPDLTPLQIPQIICESAVDIMLKGKDIFTGCGLLNSEAALMMISEADNRAYYLNLPLIFKK